MAFRPGLLAISLLLVGCSPEQSGSFQLASGPTIKASTDLGTVAFKANKAGTVGTVRLGKHTILIEPKRVSFDGSQVGKLPPDVSLVSIQIQAGKVTIRAGETSVYEGSLE